MPLLGADARDRAEELGGRPQRREGMLRRYLTRVDASSDQSRVVRYSLMRVWYPMSSPMSCESAAAI